MEGPGGRPDAGDAGTQSPDDDPEAALRAALSAAPAEGISVAELVAITRMSRRWIYYRLREFAADGHVEQTPRRL
jgi:DNA segregation ATPase FtsK/SpoIIIE, S-DNA-T family